jgi:hypothetical protein
MKDEKSAKPKKVSKKDQIFKFDIPPDMKKVFSLMIGITKLSFCSLFIMGAIMSLARAKYDSFAEFVPAAIVILIFGSYFYYLIRTGIWNLLSKNYKVNFFILAGFLLQIGVFILITHFAIFRKPLPVTVIIAIIVIEIIISCYDFMNLYKGWKIKRLILV